MARDKNDADMATNQAAAETEPSSFQGDEDEDNTLLSFFLSGNGSGNENGFGNHNSSYSAQPAQSPGRTVTFVHQTTMDTEESSSVRGGLDPPATPAIQFYSSTSRSSSARESSWDHTHAQPKSEPPFASSMREADPFGNTRSSHLGLISDALFDELSATARAAVSTGGISSAIAMSRQSSFAPSDDFQISPISPAAMVKMEDQESMLLPPSPVGGEKTSTKSSLIATNRAIKLSAMALTEEAPENPEEQKNANAQVADVSHDGRVRWFDHINSLAQKATSALGYGQQGQGEEMQERGNVEAQSCVVPKMAQKPFQTQSPVTVFAPPGPAGGSREQQMQVPTHLIPGQPITNMPLHYQFTAGQPAAVVPNGVFPPGTHKQLMTVYHPIRGNTTTDASECAEKKARRLARNRESARQSRRRKKELLENLSAQVSKLYTDIETERRNQLHSMVAGMARHRLILLKNVVHTMMENTASSMTQTSSDQSTAQNDELGKLLADLDRRTGPDGQVHRAVISFQYALLKQLILPKHHDFLLWLLERPHKFLTAAKELRQKSATKGPGRVTSKQVGEEITNSSGKDSEGRGKDKPERPKKQSNNRKAGIITATVDDQDRVWPLFCYDMNLSADQEEQFLQLHLTSRNKKSLLEERPQIAVACKLVNQMERGLLYQCHTTSHRSQTVLQRVLKPHQTVKYLQWLEKNKDKCRRLAKRQREVGSITSMQTTRQDARSPEEFMSVLCRKLEHGLQIESKRS